MTLEQIISGCQKNEPKAQEQLYGLYAKKLFGICMKYAPNIADAEDNLQDGFMQIYKTIIHYKNQGSFEGWAKRIMITTALQKFRKNKHLEIITNEITDFEDVEVELSDNEISIDYLLQLIRELPERYRLVFNLYVIDNFSHHEIADLLEISIGTSKSNLHRARTILKQKIESESEKNLIHKSL